MGKINVGRVLLGGIVAGIVIDLLSYLVDSVWLGGQWDAGQKALGHASFSSSQIIGFNLIDIVAGIALLWVYAAIRPKFGAGVKTAVIAALAVWFIGVVIPNVEFMCIAGLYSHRLMVCTTLGGLVETVAGGIAGAYLYKE